MKKISLLLAALWSIAAVAQPPKFGLKAGVNIATINNTTTGNSGSKTGFHIGALSHIHLSPSWALQPEVTYSRQGGEIEDINLSLNYINVPLLVQYNFDNGFRLQTGPQVGFLVGVSDKYNGSTTNVFSSDDFKSTDVSWSFGLGYLTHSGFGIDGRYNLGLSKINDNDVGKSTNRVIQLGLFYMFDNRHKAKSR
jgi:hypothetical protein